MTFDPDDDTPRSLTEVSRVFGIARGTLYNWSRLQPGLKLVSLDKKQAVSLRELTSFCHANRHLPAAERVLAVLDSGFGGSSERPDIESVLDAARSAQTAAAAHLDALIEAARVAEQVASSHRRQLELLRLGFGGYDGVLGQITAPRTLND
jgi:hypothetical protein